MAKFNQKKLTAALCCLLIVAMAGGVVSGCGAEHGEIHSVSDNPTYPESIDRDRDWEKSILRCPCALPARAGTRRRSCIAFWGYRIGRMR